MALLAKLYLTVMLNVLLDNALVGEPVLCTYIPEIFNALVGV
jgi:hypothetical protein